MSWYTAGEIVVWLLAAAILGGVLGWLLRGVLLPPQRGSRRAARRTPVVIEDEAVPAGTRVSDVDTGASGATRELVTDDSRFAPETAQDRVADVARRAAGGLTSPHDDLVRIHGVGPKIADMLESMGITSFRQVARFTPEDVEVLNDALGVFPGRIERDDWMSSARELHREVYGSEP
jgi:predicted flap endonuclease-1-like 5' DNA nuclease